MESGDILNRDQHIRPVIGRAIALIRTGLCKANIAFWFWQSLALLHSRLNIFVDDLDELGEGCYPVFVMANASQK